MNSAHLHLILNHLPVFTTVFGLILIAASRLGVRISTLRIGLYTLIAGALFAVPAYLTGEPAEELVERMAGVASNAIDAHEDIAAIALISAGLVGVFAAAMAYRLHASAAIARSLVVALLTCTAISASLFTVTAYLGGQIHHTEIASALTPNQQNMHDNDKD